MLDRYGAAAIDYEIAAVGHKSNPEAAEDPSPSIIALHLLLNVDGVS